MYVSSNDSALRARLAAGAQAVLSQVETLCAGFGRVESQWKADGTRVTAADLAISRGLFIELERQFPEDDYCSEETEQGGQPHALGRRWAWVLDPIDGTNNYALGIPFCAISLALLEHGQPVYGWVYDLARRQLIRGGPGLGLHDGDGPARAGRERLDEHSVIGLHTPVDASKLPEVTRVLRRFKLRGLGSSALHLAYAALGLLDGVVDHNVKVWDIAAGVALARAAGLRLVFRNFDPFPLRVFDVKMSRVEYVAGQPEACAELLRLLDGS